MLGRSTFQVDGRARSKYLELGAGLASTRSAMRQIRSRIVKEEQSGRDGEARPVRGGGGGPCMVSGQEQGLAQTAPGGNPGFASFGPVTWGSDSSSLLSFSLFFCKTGEVIFLSHKY